MQTKRWKFTEYSADELKYLQESLRINPIFCQLLVQRGIKTYEQAELFFRPQWKHLHSPWALEQMDQAIELLRAAQAGGLKALVCADYDVDGCCSLALMSDFLERIGLVYEPYQPDRFAEGYGLSASALDRAEVYGAGLLICLDCGIGSGELLARAQALGMEVLICDHHQLPSTLPCARAILHPGLGGYANPNLSACAVVFKLVQAWLEAEEEDGGAWLEEALDYVVLSLACDFLPLREENRVLAFLGLQRLAQTQRPGLALIRERLIRKTTLEIHDLVFGYGPLLNAAARMANGGIAVEFLRCTSVARAEVLLGELQALNEERRRQEKMVLEQAIQQIEQNWAFSEQFCTVVYGEDWHPGVLGIVAARLVERYHRPAVVLYRNAEGRWKGSGRSIAEVNIYEALGLCAEHLVQFGGHPQAVGLSLEGADLEEFIWAFSGAVRVQVGEELPTDYLEIQAELELSQVTERFWKILRQFGPFGPGNRRPIFLSKMVRDTGYSRLVGDDHLRLLVRQGESGILEGMAFGFGGYYEAVRARRPFHLCYVLEEQEYGGERRLRFVAKDMRF